MKEFMRQLLSRKVEARFYVSKGTGLMVVELTKDEFVKRKSIDMTIFSKLNAEVENILVAYLNEFVEECGKAGK